MDNLEYLKEVEKSIQKKYKKKRIYHNCAKLVR